MMKKPNSNFNNSKSPKNPTIRISKVKKGHKDLINNHSSNLDYYDKYEEMANQNTKKAKHKLRKATKIILIIVSVILALAIIIGSVFAYLYYNGKSNLANPKTNAFLPESVIVGSDGIVEYKGQKYVFDDNVSSILCIGVDKDTTTQVKADVTGQAGQADALFLLCIDNKDKKYTVLSVNRDSMTDVDVYDVKDNYTGVKNMQICLSYAYGDGKEKSCERTSTALSRMLYNMPIGTYFSLNKASIPLLNDIIGGVEVPVYNNDGSTTGETTFLEGDEAYDYIHYRDTSKIDSNSVRMKRQTSYIKAFASKFIARTKENLTTPLDVYNTLSLYSTTNLDASSVTYLATNALSDRTDINIDYKSVPGKVVEGKDGFAQYKVDEEGLLEEVLDIFYDKLESESVSDTTAATTK